MSVRAHHSKHIFTKWRSTSGSQLLKDVQIQIEFPKHFPLFLANILCLSHIYTELKVHNTEDYIYKRQKVCGGVISYKPVEEGEMARRWL